MKRNLSIAVILLLISVGLLASCSEENVGLDTDAEAPEVISTAPSNGAVDVPGSSIIQAAFSEAIEPSTSDESSFRLSFNDSLIVPGNITISANTITFTPETPLQSSTRFTATLTSVIEDLNGNHLDENFSWTFTTAEEF